MSINAHAAIKKHLAERHVDLVNAERGEQSGETKVAGEVWRPISVPGFDDLRDLHVALPVEGRVKVDPTGRVHTLAMSEPTSDDVHEARSFVTTLATHGQIEGVGGVPASRPTHRIEIDASGQRRLVRKGFSAV